MIKSITFTTYLGHFRQWLVSVVIGLTISGCAQPYVVLLDNDDGTVGKVLVTTKEGTTVLEKGREATEIGGGEAGKTFVVSEEKINKDFGTALSASPKKPASFYLYFIGGGTQLTQASEADIPKIIDEINKHPAPDLSIIGHTDTVGDDKDNERLSLERAKVIATLLKKVKVDTDKIVVESHGEKNLLIQTGNNTDEPRNRRVEVTVR
jgi:outer membrane protein OmpA-like peptidoglycan-associated protein